MLKVIVFVLMIVILSGTRTEAQARPLGESEIKEFTIKFRQGLLGMIALNLDITVNMTEELKELIDDCKPAMESLTAECKACTQAQCQRSPTFLDYLELANPYNYLEGPLDSIGNRLETAGELLKEDAVGFYNALNDLGGHLKDFPDFAKGIFDKLHEDLAKLKDKLEDFGIFIKDATEGLFDLFKDLLPFKRRKRSLMNLRELLGAEVLLRKLIDRKLDQRSNDDAEIRACMEKCPPCEKLLLPTQQDIIAAVCGSDVITKNETIQNNLLKIQTAYNYTLDEVYPIVKEVVLDLSSLTADFKVSLVTITAYSAEEYRTYNTDVEFPLFNMALGAKRMGVEYWYEKVVV
ncbi:uncharacterized protein LOC132755813 [Ruditapes philippinarum]|uniref:uncharacterized protein LOC132755813 n=1 Tax=Ruditapes philippinarum TaxID=129788 RepID=UPI00295AE354|nr:uncharacterized protein LOC132755813 [Ruditapes philippinarum]